MAAELSRLNESPTLPAAVDTSDDDPPRVLLHMPVDVRSVSLAVIALILSLFALQWAKEIVIPILLGIMVSYALNPIVSRFQRWRVPRAVGASVLLMAILAALGWGAWSLSDEANDLIETLPQVVQKVRELTRHQGRAVSTIAKVQQAAVELEAAANDASASEPAPSDAQASVPARRAPVQASASRSRAGSPLAEADVGRETSKIDVRGYLLSGTLGALAFLGQIAVIFFVALFLLASGNNFRRKMVKLAGPRLSQKKVTIETLDEITDQIQRYLLVQLGVSVCVGLATWLVFYALGLNQSAVWGVVAALTNLVPYVGAVLVSGGSAIVALVQFGTPGTALLVGASSFAIHTIVGNVLTPWWMGKASRMSPVAVFVSVLVFGWLWGVWGLLLGVPILLVVKSVCDRVEDLKPVAELLGA